MIDSIALTLEMHEIELLNPDGFTPSANGLLKQPFYSLRGRGMSCVCNPHKEDTLRFGCLPRLTLSKRPQTHGFRVSLRVDISLPKLKFGNNFDELRETDFPGLCKKLSSQLELMGVRVTPETIRNAQVSSIHYSKNLPLTDYTSCHMVIREVAKGNVSKQLDSMRTDYNNDGCSFRLHANSHEVILYDKLKDLERGKISDKRAIEKDSAVQLSLLFEPFQKPFEVLRIEARLGNRRKIKGLLDRLGLSRPLAFENLYSEQLAKAVLLDYWRMMTQDISILMVSGFSGGDLYDEICQADGDDANHAQALRLVGALAIIQKDGMAGLRARVERHNTPRVWYRLKKQLAELPVSSKMRYNPLRVAEGHLRDFKPLRLNDYRERT